jgi:hypothetical protein
MRLMRIALLTVFSLAFVACCGIQTTPNGVACQSCAVDTAKFDYSCPLVTAPCSRARISEIDKMLDGLFESRKPIVLYVHGRGNEPKKSWEKGIIVTLEKDYGVKVLMFNWNSCAFGLNRPVKEAEEGAPHLREVIERLKTYRESKPDSKAIPVSLLAHSMGNIVFRKAVDGLSLTTNDGPLFTNILMTGSDEDAEGHNIWVSKLVSSGTILITINKKDSVLTGLIGSHHGDGTTPLGVNPLPPLAENAYYLDVTGLVGKTHRLFRKERQNNQVGICNILTAMLRGGKPDLAIGPNIKQVNGRILVPVDKQNAADRCCQGVLLEADDADDE